MAKWKPFDLTWGRSIYYCTECKESIEVPTSCGKPMYKFCPMCGARMDTADTPQTESTGSPIGDYRDGVGAWQTDKLTEEEFDTMIAKGLLGQTDCDDRYAVRTDSGEVVAYACPLGCEQTDCGWK